MRRINSPGFAIRVLGEVTPERVVITRAVVLLISATVAASCRVKTADFATMNDGGEPTWYSCRDNRVLLAHKRRATQAGRRNKASRILCVFLCSQSNNLQ